MAAHETRLLLLGVIALFGPVNGYQIRRELISWQVDRWAHVRPGSIYHGLTALTGHGHLLRHDLSDGGRAVAVYELTPAGRGELDRLLRSALETVDPYDTVAFHAAFSMLPLLAPDAALACLDVRRRGLEETVTQFAPAREAQADVAPPHAVRSMALWHESAVTELAWLRGVLDDVASGELCLAPGGDGATPPRGPLVDSGAT